MLALISAKWPIAFQLALSVLGLAIIAFSPPAQGSILILSLSGESPGQIARWAVDGNARLLGAGPVPGSLVVVGERAALGGIALRRGALLLSGSASGCGEGVKA